jgi:hypothetical protein
MQHKTFKQAFMQLCVLVALSFTAFGFTANLGLDSYEIYLNNRLILKQYVNQPLSLRKLQLEKAEANDKLRINYTHCHGNGIGTGRSIAVKDERGNTLRKWDFADGDGTNVGMTIAVTELTQLERKHAHQDLSLHYASKELPKGELLAFLR